MFFLFPFKLVFLSSQMWAIDKAKISAKLIAIKGMMAKIPIGQNAYRTHAAGTPNKAAIISSPGISFRNEANRLVFDFQSGCQKPTAASATDTGLNTSRIISPAFARNVAPYLVPMMFFANSVGRKIDNNVEKTTNARADNSHEVHV
jgi:hypothetical protein